MSVQHWLARAMDLPPPHVLRPRVLLTKYIHDENLSLYSAGNDRAVLTPLRDSVRRKRRRGPAAESGAAGSAPATDEAAAPEQRE
jgi:hypothetical protein